MLVFINNVDYTGIVDLRTLTIDDAIGERTIMANEGGGINGDFAQRLDHTQNDMGIK